VTNGQTDGHPAIACSIRFMHTRCIYVALKKTSGQRILTKGADFFHEGKVNLTLANRKGYSRRDYAIIAFLLRKPQQ